jgi:hypothetical protein
VSLAKSHAAWFPLLLDCPCPVCAAVCWVLAAYVSLAWAFVADAAVHAGSCAFTSRHVHCCLVSLAASVARSPPPAPNSAPLGSLMLKPLRGRVWSPIRLLFISFLEKCRQRSRAQFCLLSNVKTGQDDVRLCDSGTGFPKVCISARESAAAYDFCRFCVTDVLNLFLLL